MKLPLNGKWRINHSSDRGLAILATKNISFDEEGYATLANRTADMFDESDSASFRTPFAVYQSPNATKEFGQGNAPFSININSLPYTISIDGLATQPSGSTNTSQAYFVGRWTVSTTSGFRYYNGSAWTDPSPSLTSGVRHPLCVHRGNNSLLVGNGAQVKQFNTSYAETTNLTLPSGIEVVGIAYNRNFAAIVTWDSEGHEAGLYIWDGATAAANYYYPLGSNRAWFVGGYKDTFVTINGLGQILKWDPSGLIMLDALPPYFTTAIMSDIDDRIDIAHDTAIVVDGEKIIFNIRTLCASKNSEPDKYNPLAPNGLWCWDPNVGFYHRHAPSGAKVSSQQISAASINTTTDVITATSAPATGTPFVYVSADSNPIGGLTENTTYYVINTGATTFKAASSRANAAAGTAIDLTSAPSGFSYGFVFVPESDYGQLAGDSYGGIVTLAGPQANNTSTSFFTIFQKYLFGTGGVPHTKAAADESDSFQIVMDRFENRGYITFQWFFTPNVRETFEKLYVKARRLLDADAKIIVKYRISEAAGFPQIFRDGNVNKIGTWTVLGASSSQFTTTADLSALKTAFDADSVQGAYEIEIIAGAGSGYLAHVSAISLAAGTYTVTIDEPIRNALVSDTFFFVIDNWLKLQTKDAEMAITSASNPDYSEFPIAGKSKKVQLRLELRGFRVQLEELEIVNTGDKPAA